MFFIKFIGKREPYPVPFLFCHMIENSDHALRLVIQDSCYLLCWCRWIREDQTCDSAASQDILGSSTESDFRGIVLLSPYSHILMQSTQRLPRWSDQKDRWIPQPCSLWAISFGIDWLWLLHFPSHFPFFPLKSLSASLANIFKEHV